MTVFAETTAPSRESASPRGRVGLFVTCLVDLFRPSAALAAVRLIEGAGYEVTVPQAQTCCGQPAYNGGDFEGARALARRVVDAFAAQDHVVVPSGSCAGMIKVHVPALLASDAAYGPRARDLAARTYELTSFLVHVARVASVPGRYRGRLAYHDSCSSLRELGLGEEARQLLAAMAGVTLAEIEGREECCGFGGTFCVKYPEISARMVADKTRAIVATRADTLVGPDLGCLLNIAGRLMREGAALKVRHIAEILAGLDEGPAIGEADRR
jgi:L-lactate dehydrogenase complex protein LldE